MEANGLDLYLSKQLAGVSCKRRLVWCGTDCKVYFLIIRSIRRRQGAACIGRGKKKQKNVIITAKNSKQAGPRWTQSHLVSMARTPEAAPGASAFDLTVLCSLGARTPLSS